MKSVQVITPVVFGLLAATLLQTVAIWLFA
jgi:hypothetical protein